MTRPPNPELRQRILDRAEEIVSAEGHNALNMRRLAKDVGVTATAIYGYFDSKDELLSQIKLRAAKLLNAAIAAVPPSLGAHETLHELGRRYLDFAEENQHLYKLLFEAFEGGIPSEEELPVMYHTYYTARNALERMVASGEAALEPAYGALMGWVMLHGFCSLLISGRLELAEELDRDQLKRVFLHFYTGGGAPKMPGCEDGEDKE